MRTFLLVLLVAGTASAAEISFTSGPRPVKYSLVRDYAACLKAIDRGEEVYLSVGVNPLPGDYSTYSLRLLDGTSAAAGRYRCWKQPNGGPGMLPAEVTPAVVPVLTVQPPPAAPRSFGIFGGTFAPGGS